MEKKIFETRVRDAAGSLKVTLPVKMWRDLDIRKNDILVLKIEEHKKVYRPDEKKPHPPISSGELLKTPICPVVPSRNER